MAASAALGTPVTVILPLLKRLVNFSTCLSVNPATDLIKAGASVVEILPVLLLLITTIDAGCPTALA